MIYHHVHTCGLFIIISRDLEDIKDLFALSLKFKMWSTVDDKTICRFTSESKDKPIGKYYRFTH